MCGIIGGRSTDPISSLLFNGLKTLEYRGYDSFGILTYTKQDFNLEKKVGAPSAFKDENFSHLSGNCGLAHTRWATHGQVSIDNAHPHLLELDGIKVALVHNGIVENNDQLYSLLKKHEQDLLQSQTDSEILCAHILLKIVKQNLSPQKAFDVICEQIKGQFALLVSIQTPKQTFFFARRHILPLYVSKNTHLPQEQLFSSDKLALQHLDRKIYKLCDHKTFSLGQCPEHLKPIDFECSEQTFLHSTASKTLRENPSSRSLVHESFMQKEIFEQTHIIKRHFEKNDPLNNLFNLEKFKTIDFIGCGTSLHAAQIAAFWIEKYLNIPSRAYIASEFKYSPPVVLKDKSLMILISQSGETADILGTIDSIKERYVHLLALCNNSSSTLVELADSYMSVQAGPEIGVASTKAFTAQGLCLIKLLCHFSKKVSFKEIIQPQAGCQFLHQAFEVIFSQKAQLLKLANYLSDFKHLLILGRGHLARVACEGALKIKEVTYIHAQAIPTGEMKHGSLALIDKTCPVIIMINNDHFLDKNLLACQELLARGAKLIVFADEFVSLTFASQCVSVFPIPHVHELFESLIFTLPFQLLALQIGEVLGRNVDKPRNLAKSVTVE